MRIPLLFVLALVQLAGLLLFAKGFFPGKVVLKGDGEFYHDDAPFEARYDRLIVMVVDAMRSDFMFSTESQMTYVHELINRGEALGFTAYSNPPTVTLPRLKGITTGATPNFLDAILNIAEEDTSSTLGDQDSWVKEMYLKGMRINMFGDDTWLKLFPTYFSKTDGTGSFYVADFTEVDLNVTRNLPYEISHQNEWDVMILHYLGLDHIGHKGGPQSPHMPKKQQEMDAIVRLLYEEVVSKDPRTLLVVMGDHGMNDIGNHGGSSAGETSPALLFVSQELGQLRSDSAPLAVDEDFSYYRRVQQIDLVPTLSALFGFPIPKNNLGVFIEDFLPLFSEKRAKRILLQNAYQIRNLLEKGGVRVQEELAAESIDSIQAFLRAAQDELAGASSNYNYNDIYVGFALFAAPGLVHVALFAALFSQEKLAGLGYLVSFGVYAATFFGSSLIEEEHQVWWWLVTPFCVILFFQSLRSGQKGLSPVLMLALMRLMKGWNNSGQKFNLATNLKIGTVLESNRDETLGISILACYLFSAAVTRLGKTQDVLEMVNFLGAFLLGSIGASIKVLSTYEDLEETPKVLHSFVLWIMANLEASSPRSCLVPMFQLFYSVLAAVLVVRLASHRFWPSQAFFSDLSYTIAVVLIMQTSQKNVGLLVVMLLLRWSAGSTLGSATQIAAFSVLLQHFSFFSFGSTNSLSTVDLTNSFNGVSDYGLVSVGILTYIANFAGPLFVILSTLVWLYEYNALEKYDAFYRKSLVQFTFYSVAGVFLMLACYSLRFHLFIWTVFSPKVLYYLSWFLTNFVFDFVCGLVLVALF